VGDGVCAYFRTGSFALVSDEAAPSWRVLCDAEGNEAGVSSVAGRG
jgi:hypothetical protein